jgi:hypothetical protein
VGGSVSGARTIETLDHPEMAGLGYLRVRLCEGEQVLAERALDFDRTADWQDWAVAQTRMKRHDDLLQQASGSASAATERKLAAANFAYAVRVLFPEFGTPPDGVELG